jgi:soluble lytic murein transglycosylase-like protein
VPLLKRAVAPIVVVAVLALGGTAGTYVVRPGDTLSSIAGHLGVSVGDLAKANHLTDPDRVAVGQALTVPSRASAPPSAAPSPARTHVVAPGETLTAIAAKYGTTVPAIMARNHLPDANHLRVGATLQLPPAAPATGLPARLVASPNRMARLPHFTRWAIANDLDPALVMAVAWQESGWQNDVVSPAGAIGIGQLLPATARFVSDDLIGVDLDVHVPAENIRMTARYVRWLLTRSGGNVDVALAGYFQGPSSVAAIGDLPATVDYIAVVKQLRTRFASALSRS